MEIEEAADIFGVVVRLPRVTSGRGFVVIRAVMALEMLLFAEEKLERLSLCLCLTFTSPLYFFNSLEYCAIFSSVVS